MRKKLLFIVNPVSGRRLYGRYAESIDRVFAAQGWDVTVFETEKSGDARDEAAHRGREYDRIVCMGGDGTLSETVNGLAAIDFAVPLGYIPAGSTNDFAMSMGFAPDVLAAAEDAAGDEVHYMDVMSIDGRCSINTANVGAFASVAYETPQDLKNALGLVAYILSGIKDLSRIKAEHLRVTTADAVVEGDYFFAAICNSTAMGESFSHSLPDDGILDMLLVRKPASLAELHGTVTHLVGGEYSDKCIDLVRAPRITVETQQPCTWVVDGERYDAGTVTNAEVLHRKLRLIVPAQEDNKSAPSRQMGRWLAFDTGKPRHILRKSTVAADDLTGDE